MRVLLVDDHALFREGIAMLLASLGPTESVLEAGSVETALVLLSRGDTIDLVLMDLVLPGMSGLDGIARLKLDHPGLPVVALSSSDDRESVLAALDAGAMGYIPKSARRSGLTRKGQTTPPVQTTAVTPAATATVK